MAIKPKIFKQMSKLIAGSMSVGRYDVKLAETEEEIKQAQNLRYRVLFQESGGQIDASMELNQREEDEWDKVAYHVIVLDRKDEDNVVGTVRLVSQQNLLPNQAFYTENAFDLSKLKANYQNIIELSRACICKEGRGGAILMLIWKFTMNFIEQNNFDLLFGCASFKGTDYEKHQTILSYLYDKHLAEEHNMPEPVVKNSVPISSFRQTVGKGKDRGKIPTMLRGYLKIGARISKDAIIDEVFNTTFVAIYVDAEQMFGLNHVLVNKSAH
jgi:putative hemolysin